MSHDLTPQQRGGGQLARSVEFRKQREQSWQELEQIVSKIEGGGLDAASAEELSRLPHLYRQTLSALNVARSFSLDRNLLIYLESLSSRAYVAVYSTRSRPFSALGEFVWRGFPLAVYQARRHVGVAGLVLGMGVLVAMVMVLDEPDAFHTFVAAGYAQGRGPDTSPEELRAVLFGGGELQAEELSQFSSMLMTHNSKIGMLCFALSFAVGLPTLYLLFENGAVLGAFIALHMLKGLSVELFSWLLPHGITEILAVLLCGGAGLMVAEALVFPGRHTRLENMARRGREAGVVVLGAVGLFLIAGVIEGVFRQSVQSIPIRYGMATLTACLWGLYFGVWGGALARQARAARLEEEEETKARRRVRGAEDSPALIDMGRSQ